ncbi:tetratricopeptide repeat protein [Mucilaginibacter sp. dw_454]|uniref:tetratricopeptide repeat protein n=1 Tax=Mucilaginibacter sp. dw_454 TaxID=2720079 RepID=UPI001BD3D9BE|nr:tetratricopeptide repeat protein [Mucilaginibacter sp. dw_454]
MNYQVNRLSINGNDNIVFQNVDGNTVTTSLDKLIREHTREKDAHIQSLQHSLFDKDKINELSEYRINALREELDKELKEKAQLERQVQELIQEFADKDISDTGTLYQEAFKLFLEGRLADALAKLSDSQLEAEYLALKAQEQKLNQGKRKMADTFLLKARMLVMDGKSSNAAAYYEKAVEACPEWNYWQQNAYFYSYLNNAAKAEECYKRAMEIAETADQKAKSAEFLAVLIDRKDAARARQLFLEAISLYEQASGLEGIQSFVNLASVSGNFAKFLYDRDEPETAFAYITQALNYYKQLAESQPEAYLADLASTYANYGILLMDQDLLEKAEEQFVVAMHWYDELDEKGYSYNEMSPVMLLNNLGSLLSLKNDVTAALSYFEKALRLNRDLVAQNPEAYLPLLGKSLNSYANVLGSIQKWDQAKDAFMEGIGIYDNLIKIDREQFLPDLAMLVSNLALMQSNQGYLELAADNYLRALAYKVELNNKYPGIYEHSLALTLNDLSTLESETGDLLETAEINSREGIRLLVRLVEKNRYAYLVTLANNFTNLATILKRKNKQDEAEQYYNLALQLYIELYKREPQVYISFLIKALFNIGSFYQNGKPDKEQSIGYAQQIIYASWQHFKPEEGLQQIALAGTILARWGIDLNDFMRSLMI